jgi:two-component system, sensor histidine kinase and response regulator
VADAPGISAAAPPAGPMADDAVILMVDDRQDNLDVLQALLARPGVRLLGASGGDEALELLLQHDVALALVDVQMPGMTGFELAELMRGTERTRHVPIIFVTAGSPEHGRIFRGYEAGAVDFLFKPIEPQLLRSKVGVFLELYRQRELLKAQVQDHKQLVHTAELLIGVLGHDLRTPLSAIVTGGQMLLQAYPEDPRIQQVAGRIQSSSQRMTRLIEQLLDFATARLGTLPMQPRSTDLGDLCRTALVEFKARRDGLELAVDGDVSGSWDPDRLMQLVSNLLGNAVQHGDADGLIELGVRAAAGDHVELRVRNAGMLPESIRSTIFAPFVRSDSASRGTGLGLYIVDQIARAHGGSVTAESAAGQTTFLVRLPRLAPAATGG